MYRICKYLRWMYRLFNRKVILYMKKTVVVLPYGGLCNRLYAMKSAYYIAKEKGFLMVILWEDYPIEKFDNYFEAICGVEYKVVNLHMHRGSIREYIKQKKWRKVIGMLFTKYKADMIELIYRTRALYGRGGVKLTRDYGERVTVVQFEDAKKIFFKTCHNLFGPMVFDWIRFKSLYYEQAEKIMNFKDKSTVLGVHIRESYIVGNLIEQFEDIIDEFLLDSQHRFFLATDVWTLKRKFIEKYKTKCIYQPTESKDSWTALGQKEGIIDLICLSKTCKIIGTQASTFSEVAAAIGKIPLKLLEGK